MSVWLPMLSTDLVARRGRREAARGGGAASLGGRAVLLIATEGQRQVVARRCRRAMDAGVRVGMAATQARALFGSEDHFRALPFDPAGDRRALRGLAVWAQRLSPIVGIEDPDERDGAASMTAVRAQGLTLDVTGCAHLFAPEGDATEGGAGEEAGGEAGMIRAAEEGLRSLGVAARAAIGPSFGCAWAVARFGPRGAPSGRVVAEGGARGAIGGMPIAALGVGESVSQQLAEVGIERVGEALAMPRGALGARFGEDLLLRIDRALGRGIEAIEAVRPVPPPAAERVFEGPTDRMEAIERTVRELLGEVAAALSRRVCGARRVVVELARTDLAPEVLTVELGRPSRDAGHLWALVRPGLERANLGAEGFGVEGVRVGVPAVGRVEERQGLCLAEGGAGGGVSRDDAERAGAELLDTLRNRLGEARVVRAGVVESHLPERAFAWRPVGEARERGVDRARVTGSDRPTVLFERPVPAEVWALTPDGPVHRVVWNGETHEATACVGPERIGGEWWRRRDGATERRSARGSDAGTRECFRVRLESGAWVWVVRAMGSGRWFVCGVW